MVLRPGDVTPTPGWCDTCQVHRVDHPRTTCPVCTDRRRLDNAAQVAAIGHRLRDIA